MPPKGVSRIPHGPSPPSCARPARDASAKCMEETLNLLNFAENDRSSSFLGFLPPLLPAGPLE